MTGYTTPEMREIWSDEHLLSCWADVEIAVLQAQTEEHRWPEFYLDRAQNTPHPTVEMWRTATEATGHEVVAFLQEWGLPRIHVGMTSSDVVDTALALRLKEANRLLVRYAVALRETLVSSAWRHKDTTRLGRTHGQPAVEDRFGHRLADLAYAVDRSIWRLMSAEADLAVAKISGPTGTYMHITRETEARAAELLGLKPTPSATQIVMRDSLASWAADVAVLVSICEAIATEIRLGSHDSVGELAEPTRAGQVGSSAMPHKRNPIISERVTGLSRIARSAVVPLMEGISQFHERDLAHSSVERVELPLLCGVAAYSLRAMVDVVGAMYVYSDRMAANLHNAGTATHTHSAMYYAQLGGMSYTDAHEWVTRVWRSSHTVAQFWREVRLMVPAARLGQPNTRYTILDARRLGSTPKEN